MKLQQQVSRKTKNKVYNKWSITLPSELVRELGWKAGDDVETKLKEGKLLLSRKPTEGAKKVKEIKVKGTFSFFEKFMLVYYSLPMQERKMPIAVINKQAITWEMAHREIKQKTVLGKDIGKKLISLGII